MKQNKCVFIAFGGSWNSQARVPLQFKALADELSKRGFTVISIIQGKPDPKLANEKDVYYWPSKRPTKLRDAFFFYKLVRKFKPSLIITQFAATNIMLLVGWLTKIPHRIVWYHTMSKQIENDWKSSYWRLRFLRLRKSLIYHFATNISFVSKAARDDFENTYFSVRNSVIFYNGMKTPEELSDPLSNINKNVVCVGRLDPSKGQDVLIHAFRQVVDQVGDAKLILIGAGPKRDYLDSLIQNLHLENSIMFVGKVSPEDVIKNLNKGYISVVPSREEAFGFVVIESMSVGTPVIASSVGGIPEIIRDGVDGCLVPPEDTDALAEKIILLLKNPELRNKMSENALDRFLSTFELSKIVNHQADWIEELLIKE